MTTSILMLGTADWNQPIATNQHYVARELAVAHPVTFIESMGLRRPELRRSDLGRIVNRLRPVTRTVGVARGAENIRVVRPVAIPLHRGPARVVNRAMLTKLAEEWRSQPGDRLLWTYTPNTYGLEKYAHDAVYHCVDLLRTVKGIDAALIDAQESRLARAGVRAISSSAVVRDHLDAVGFRDVRLWSNVADTAPIAAAVAKTPGRVQRAVFAGNLTASKVDFNLISMLVDRGIRVDLAGPVSEGGGSSAGEVEELERRGATYHGHLSFEQLSELYASSTVGLIPYALNDYTAGVNPLKTFEYLAAGLTVVSTPVPAVEPRPGHVHIASSAADFIEAVEGAISEPSASQVSARATIAAEHSWVSRGVQVRGLVSELTRGRAS